MTREMPSFRPTDSRPEIQSRAASLFFSASFFSSPFEFFVVGFGWFLAVAVVGFIVERDDVLKSHQIGHDALDHLAFGFERIELLADAALEQLPATFG